MSTQSKTQSAKVSAKREAILTAALETFAERGVNGVAVPEIATHAKVGTGTIYRYFPSKEALVNALFMQEKSALAERLSESMEVYTAPKAMFDEFWRRLVAFARQRPQAFRFLELQDHLPYLDKESRALERRLLVPIAKHQKRLQEQGVFRDDIRVEVLMALIWGAFVNLFKAERGGYLTLSEDDISAARDACWQLCTRQA
ncbi:hypothetical protein CAI21_19240 [Alkalilimnicola ehrlichii]|uniref:HTH tetR-type domain-containing protein n=1 Tax=Alkalilimnicola ehrlichii TaxID=351052 RepID=A0A3E0WKD2_9GAMM|nr:TetR/AcrR family transcriptional regulator [Alkalilimnicola ehrlichii]RFA25371.1 hypothetical protein CAI21_19240 [Alkalilimnicola ehrlichii]RFA32547.1 hypothetical protein CAL65_19505 [Alkalilimnicola ehrlichii]